MKELAELGLITGLKSTNFSYSTLLRSKVRSIILSISSSKVITYTTNSFFTRINRPSKFKQGNVCIQLSKGPDGVWPEPKEQTNQLGRNSLCICPGYDRGVTVSTRLMGLTELDKAHPILIAGLPSHLQISQYKHYYCRRKGIHNAIIKNG